MRKPIQQILALLVVLLGGWQAVAGPQQMVFFRQRVRIGSRGGTLSVACGYRPGKPPGPSDRYAYFSGDARVTRYEKGKPAGTAPLSEAVGPRGWLQMGGPGVSLS